MRGYNFSAGPATLPEEILLQAKEELLEYGDCQASILEISHRSNAVADLMVQADADLRELLTISDDYSILFLHGGATTQFAMLPLNLLAEGQSADYVNTGIWSKKAIMEAKTVNPVNVVASSEAVNFTDIPAPNTWQCQSDAGYFHYTDNETIGGVEFDFVPEVGDVPLVSDMSSNILSRPVDVNRFGVIYAGAQKNIGPAGLAIMIIRKDLLGRARATTPSIFNYTKQAEMDSKLNTPPVYACYFAALMFAWVKQQGGLAVMTERSQAKANKLYDYIDQSDFYSNPVAKHCRSRMNIPFILANPELDAEFLAQAKQADLLNLKGHRLVGGMRASIYNAMPEAGVDALIDFMRDFAKKQ